MRKGIGIARHIASMAFGCADALTGGRCPPEVTEARLAICRVCEKLKTDDNKMYCGACGCPKWKLSELSTKLTFARLNCPLRKWSAYEQPIGGNDLHVDDDRNGDTE